MILEHHGPLQADSRGRTTPGSDGVVREVCCPSCMRMLYRTDAGPAAWATVSITPRCRDCGVSVSLVVDEAGSPALIVGAPGESQADVHARGRAERRRVMRALAGRRHQRRR